MDAFLFSANAVLPIVLLVFLGWLLKKVGLFGNEFLRVGNKLTFKVLLPVLLFYNVYSVQNLGQINWQNVLFAVVCVLIAFAFGIVVALLFTKDNAQRGVLVQAIFRSNFALIGIPLATNLFGASGAAAASILSAFAVPLFNILAVIALSLFNNGNGKKTSVKSVVVGVVTNPLILGVAAGLSALCVRAVFAKHNIAFRLSDIGFLYTSIKYVSNTATPFALLVLGGQFAFSAVKKLWKPIVLTTVLRTVVVPVTALVAAYFVFPNISGEYFAAYIAAFGTPVAVSSAIMAKEMGGDDELAGQLVVWTTIASAFTLFGIVSVCKMVGIF